MFVDSRPPLRVVRCSMFVVRCSLFVVCCVLFCCVLFALPCGMLLSIDVVIVVCFLGCAIWLLFVVRCVLLFGVCCLLCVGCC